jgi:hypothetical protein
VAIALLLAGLTGCGGGGDDEGPAAAATKAASSDPASPPSSAGTVPAGSAPQAVCDFADSWQPIDGQLDQAEADQQDAALWGDTADAIESVTAPEALTVWPILAGDVRKYADLLAQHDSGGAQAFVTTKMPELQQLHGTVHDLFAQACP